MRYQHENHPEIVQTAFPWKWLVVIAIVVVIQVALALSAKAATYLPHPQGCPRVLFCACGAAVEIFNKPIRSLWLAKAWLKFPRVAVSNARPGMVAYRPRRGGSGHVFVLKRQIKGSTWLVADFNSGRGKSRLHNRSIAGRTIVNPYMRTASR